MERTGALHRHPDKSIWHDAGKNSTLSPMIAFVTKNEEQWTDFLSRQRFRPFLQSWTMGEVYREVGQEPHRIIVTNAEGETQAICAAYTVDAKRGKHLILPYGPLIAEHLTEEEQKEVMTVILEMCSTIGTSEGCSFLRMSPFWQKEKPIPCPHRSSPLHLLAEHVWYLPLTENDRWSIDQKNYTDLGSSRKPEEMIMLCRKTTRNLIGRAKRDGVTIRRSNCPMEDLEKHFIRLHDETRKRHGFTPYSNAFFRAQVRHCSAKNECTIYLADYEGEVISASIHMHAFGETSYHHGASASAFSKIPASYLLQWTAIEDAIARGDAIYNFWGIAPMNNGELCAQHPFAGVTLFKTGFGGALLNLPHCIDIPLSKKYYLTYLFEHVRKWRRGF